MFSWLKKLFCGVQPLGPNQTSWLKELESGKYQQGSGLLCQYVGEGNKPTYCCLGVACHNFGVDFTTCCGIVHYLGESCNAPHPVITALALYSKEGCAKNCMKSSLISLNDIYRLSFKEIAALIRKDPNMYFSEPR